MCKAHSKVTHAKTAKILTVMKNIFIEQEIRSVEL